MLEEVTVQGNAMREHKTVYAGGGDWGGQCYEEWSMLEKVTGKNKYMKEHKTVYAGGDDWGGQCSD